MYLLLIFFVAALFKKSFYGLLVKLLWYMYRFLLFPNKNFYKKCFSCYLSRPYEIKPPHSYDLIIGKGHNNQIYQALFFLSIHSKLNLKKEFFSCGKSLNKVQKCNILWKYMYSELIGKDSVDNQLN